MKQEVRIQLDVSLTLDAKHSDQEVLAMVERGARNAWPNNHKYFHALRYAEERHIYHGKDIQWQTLVRRPISGPDPSSEKNRRRPEPDETYPKPTRGTRMTGSPFARGY